MMAAIFAMLVVAAIFLSGALAVDYLIDRIKISGILSVCLLGFGIFGLYALIVGK